MLLLALLQRRALLGVRVLLDLVEDLHELVDATLVRLEDHGRIPAHDVRHVARPLLRSRRRRVELWLQAIREVLLELLWNDQLARDERCSVDFLKWEDFRQESR